MDDTNLIIISNNKVHIGRARNPCTKATIGETTTVAGTDTTPEVAIVWATTAKAVTGHNRDTGHLVLNMAMVAVAATADITEMIVLVSTVLTATTHRMLLTKRRTVPAAGVMGEEVELLVSVMLVCDL